MHFAIPEIKEIKSDTSYTVYRLYINGLFHSNVRYSQLYTFNDNMKQFHGANSLPLFPSKKIFTLSQTQLEERQYCLQKYFQSISQITELVNSPVLKRFLLSIQMSNEESRLFISNELTVHVLNGNQINVNVDLKDSSEVVLQKVCEQLRVPEELVQYFSLFIMCQTSDLENHIIHYLQDYECPILTLTNIQGTNKKIIIRRSCWDLSVDAKLMRDHSTLNLIYAQTVYDIQKSSIEANDEAKSALVSLQSRGAKREYLELAKTMKYFGFIRFYKCTCDYPEVGTETTISIGQTELIFTHNSETCAPSEKETSFKITRIRCWKITRLNDFNDEVQLSFEYLINSHKLQWITVLSKNVYFLSVCLQSVVDELIINKKSSLNSYDSSKTIFNQPPNIHSEIQSNVLKDQKKKIYSKSKFLSSVTLLENDSFENIGNDDL